MGLIGLIGLGGGGGLVGMVGRSRDGGEGRRRDVLLFIVMILKSSWNWINRLSSTYYLGR